MTNSKGNLLISTKSGASGRKTVMLVCCAIMFIFGIACIAAFGVFQDMGRDVFGSKGAGGVLCIILVAFFWGYAGSSLLITFLGSKSYCEVYENAVTGRTALSRRDPNAPMQDFDLSYRDIENVTEAGKSILIYTKYATLEVLALKNRAEAVSEIRARMGK